MYSGRQQAVHHDHSTDNMHTDDRLFRKTNETYERYVFNSRRQEAHETVDDYISALCNLASTCNFCDCLKDSLLRDRIVLGISGSSTRKRLLQEADLNLETCIAMCRAAEATSPSQPVKTVTWTEDTTAVQAGSVSSGDFSLSLRRCDPMPVTSPDEAEMSEVKIKTELDDSDDDSALQWTTEHQSSGFPRDRTERNIIKQEPAWSVEEDHPDQPSAVYSTAQPMSDNTSGPLLSPKTSHVCQHCSAAFALVSSLELHLVSVHGETLHMVLPGSSKPDRCDAGDCSNTNVDKVVTYGVRKRRRKRKFDDNDADDEDGTKNVCDVCKRAFSRPDHLRRHKKLIHGYVSSFVCNVCYMRFTGPGDLKAHKLTHTHKPFVCDVCSKGFTHACHLETHQRIHTGERPFKCPHCDSGFKESCTLQDHVKRVHDGLRPHLCDFCGAAFSKVGDLTKHRRTHTGEKPFVCTDCGKGFSESSNLAKHRRTHTGEKPHVCPECGKGFTTSGQLTQHRVIHSGQKPHSCPHCPSAFTQAHRLKIHVQNKHQ